jgi:hypothetical protein
MKKLIFILPVLIIFLSSCGKSWCDKFHPPSVVKSDTVKIETCVTEHDTAIKTLVDSSQIRELLECDKNGQITLKEFQDYKMGIIAKVPTLSIHNNVLTADCKCDSAKIHAILKDRETKITEKSSVTITMPPVQVKYVPKFTQIFSIIGMACVGAGILFGLFMAFKSKL